MANERQIILELKAKMADVGELRASNMELIDQLEKAKIAVDKLTNIRDKQKAQIQVRKCKKLRQIGVLSHLKSRPDVLTLSTTFNDLWLTLSTISEHKKTENRQFGAFEVNFGFGRI